VNPLTRAIADASTHGFAEGLVTLLFLVTFTGWAWWAFNPANRAQHEANARLPLSDDEGGTP